MNNIESLTYFTPELILVAGIVVVILADLIFPSLRRILPPVFTLITIGASATAAILLAGAEPVSLFSGLLSADRFAFFFKVFFAIVTALVVLVSIQDRSLPLRRVAEYHGLLLTVTLGMYLMAASADLLMIYIGIEMVSIPSYILAGYLKGDRRSTEAALKYMIYGGVSSGIMIYGMSLLFGMLGTTHLPEMATALATRQVGSLPLSLVVLLILTGFGFKMATVPFHFWCPDVYEGAPTPITAFLSVGPKAAGFAVTIRFFYQVLSEFHPGTMEFSVIHQIDWPLLLAVISVATMTLGNLVAMVQNNIKRLLAYSSIAHAGYIMMGVVMQSIDGLQAVLFYLVIYLTMNLGAFFVIITLNSSLRSEEIDSYEGLGWRAPLPAIAMTIFLFSLTGIPPFAGFLGKLYVFAAVVKGKMYWFALVGFLNSVVSLYYYVRIVKKMFLDQPRVRERISLPFLPTALITLLAVPNILLILYWVPVIDLAGRAVQFLWS